MSPVWINHVLFRTLRLLRAWHHFEGHVVFLQLDHLQCFSPGQIGHITTVGATTGRSFYRLRVREAVEVPPSPFPDLQPSLKLLPIHQNASQEVRSRSILVVSIDEFLNRKTISIIFDVYNALISLFRAGCSCTCVESICEKYGTKNEAVGCFHGFPGHCGWNPIFVLRCRR